MVGSLLAAPIERRIGRARVLQLAVAGAAIQFPAMALTSSTVAVALSWSAGGLMIIGWNVVTVSLRQRIVPDHLLGRVNAGYRLLAWGTMPLGAAVGGALAEVVGIRSVFVFAFVAHVLLLLVARTVTDAVIEAADTDNRLPAGAGGGDLPAEQSTTRGGDR